MSKGRLIVILLLTFFTILCSFYEMESTVKKLANRHYLIRHENISIEIDPYLGARIISAKIDNEELLLQERDSLLNWGSTFWIAPQSLWKWPPPEAIQYGSYDTAIHDDTLILTSEIDQKFGFRVCKRLHFNISNNSLEICYEIINETDSSKWIGPWEVTVIPSGGAKVFYPSGKEVPGTRSNIQFDEFSGIAWYEYKREEVEDWHKIFRIPQKGWLGHVNKNRTLFIKTFSLVQPKYLALGHGNIEVYISKKSEYIELENHGVYEVLQPGEKLVYNVKWYIGKLPEHISDKEYSNELLNHVNSVVSSL